MRTAFAVLVLASLVAAEPAAPAPVAYPKPLHMTILGLSITAIAVVGARASRRSTDTMMYMVLRSLAVTAIMVAYADKVHQDALRGHIDYLKQLGKPAGP